MHELVQCRSGHCIKNMGQHTSPPRPVKPRCPPPTTTMRVLSVISFARVVILALQDTVATVTSTRTKERHWTTTTVGEGGRAVARAGGVAAPAGGDYTVPGLAIPSAIKMTPQREKVHKKPILQSAKMNGEVPVKPILPTT